MTRTWDAANEAGTRRVKQFRYDANGRKTFESYSLRDVALVTTVVDGTTTGYEALGRPVSQVQASELGPLTTTTEYLSGFQRRTTNPRGHATTHTFQAFDAPSEDVITGIAAPAGVNVAISRDVFGKASAITRSGGGKSATRSYAYDGFQRLCRTVEPETGATLQAYFGASTNVAWRASGLPSTTACGASVAAGQMVNFTYDTRNRLWITTYGDGSPGTNRTYTADGLPLQVWTANSSWTYSYNNRRKLEREVLSFGGVNRSLTWGVDAYGNVASLTYPDDAAVNYAANALGEPTQVSGYASAVTHFPDGTVAGYTLANGVVHSVTQNLRGLPATWRDAGVVQDAYGYDANGNVLSIVDQQEGVSTRSMGYDALDRLSAANGVWGTGAFTYDALDNLLTSAVGARSLSHNINAVTHRLDSLSGSLSLAMGYDANGNITQRGAQAFVFDIGNRLLSATGKATYTYDGHGRRLQADYADGSWKLQVYGQGGKLLFGQHSSQGNTRHVYLGDKLIAETTQGVTSFTHTDALGSPVARSSSTGAVLTRTRYEPYGATAAGTNPTGIGFTGHVNDADTGLVYMQQRYYDPIAGRFLSVDPVTTDAKTGGFFNRYVYGNNNPYKFKDPDGRASCADKDCKTSTIDPQVKRADGGATKITFVNDNPKGASPDQPIATKTATTIEGVVSAANVDSVNINSTTGGDHSKTSAHYSGRAVDINKVDGKPVGANNTGAGRVQAAAQSDKNIRENFGPNIMEKRSGADRAPATVTDQKLIDAHETHIHLSTQP